MRKDISTIDTKFAKRAIADHFQKTKKYHIRFFGSGEPTLEINKIKEIYSYVSKITEQKIEMEIQTNGIFSDTTAIWLAKHMDTIYISWDGIPEIHNQYRPTISNKPTSYYIEKNIKLMRQTNPNITICARTTVLPETVNKQITNMNYFKSFGINAYLTNPVFPSVGDRHSNLYSHINKTDFIMNYAKEFINTYEYGKQINMFVGSFLTMNFDEEVEYSCRACLPTPHVTSNGYVSACDMSIDGNVLQELVYGYYDEEKDIITYDEEKIHSISQRKASNLTECSDCPVLYHCAGGCVGECLNETGSLFGVKKDYCNAVRYLYQNLKTDGSLFQYFMP